MEAQCHRTTWKTEMKRKPKSYSQVRKHLKRYRQLRNSKRFLARIGRCLRWLKYLNPFYYLTHIDRYIISKFIGTYIYSIILYLMSTRIVQSSRPTTHRSRLSSLTTMPTSCLTLPIFSRRYSSSSLSFSSLPNWRATAKSLLCLLQD